MGMWQGGESYRIGHPVDIVSMARKIFLYKF